MSSSNEVKVTYAPEAVFGVQDPPVIDWQVARMTGETMSGTPDTVVSNEIRSDRMTAGSIATDLTVGGDLNGEFSAVTWDVFLEAVVAGTWTTDVLKVGSEKRSFTFQKNFSDISAGAYIQLTGMTANTFTIGMSTGEIMTAVVNFVGAQVAAGTTPYADATDTETPATTTTPFNATSNVTSVKVDDADFTGCIQTMSLPINNNAEGSKCIGTYGNKAVLLRSSRIEGSMTFLFDDIDLYNSILNNTFKKFEFTVADAAGNIYVFLLPKAQLTGAAPSATAIDTDVAQDVTINAHYDETEGSSIVITRTLV